jgi:putative tributyrin esterase
MRLRADFPALTLGLDVSMTVLLPDPGDIRPSAASGLLYLLHGLTDDDTAWTRRTAIERYVAGTGLAVVMPQVHRSYYRDGVYTGAYWTFLTEELPALLDHHFSVDQRPERTAVAGLSMGGYGAMCWALSEPSRFAAAGSFSGSLGVASRIGHGGTPAVDPLLRASVFGEQRIEGTASDPLHLVCELASRDGSVPALYVACGEQDERLTENLAFCRLATQAAVPLTSRFAAGGHEWDYWDRCLVDFLGWLTERST